MIRAGSGGPVELESVRTWDPRTGWVITRRFRGQKEFLLAYEAAHKSAGAKTDWEPTDDGALAVLRATYGAEETQAPGEALSERWELVGNDLEKSLWELPKVVAELAKIVQDTARPMKIAMLKTNVERLSKGNSTLLDINGDEDKQDDPVPYFLNIVLLMGLDPAVFLSLICTLASEVTSWTISQWVLRCTKVIANNSTIKPSLLNVGKVYGTEQLRTAELIPSTIKFDLPSGYWLKRTPTIEQTAADKWTISQEWWHADAYDPFIYEVAS